GYPFVSIAHPVANNDDATLRSKAEAAMPRIVSLLTQRPV
ncbi:MAG: UGSC family (seleno)protein, partial [Burkholderiales bacterium]